MDYYKILGVDKNATDEQIKSAYRTLAKKHHPDMNNGNKQSEEMFKKINEAYEKLSDPLSKSAYDRSQSGDGRFSRGFGGFGDYTIFNTDFENMFGTSSKHRKQDDHINLNVSVDFEKLLGDHIISAEMDEFEQCEKCHYLGIDKECTNCKGTGKIKKKVSIKVPVNMHKKQYAYTVEGDILKLILKVANRSADGRDILLRVSAKIPENVVLNGSNVIHTVNISLSEALFGPDPTFITIDGSKFKIKLAAVIKKDFSEIFIKISERGIMGVGRRGTYVFNVKVSFPDTSILEQSDIATLKNILGKL